MMPSEGIDYVAVLADLEAKRAALDNAIAAVRQILNLGAEEGATSAPASQEKREQGTEVRFDSFFGMSTPDAVRKFLSMMKRPQALSDIVKALQEGGLPTTSSNLMGVVGPTLSRMKAAGDVISVQGRWGLTEWYTGARRERLEALAKGKPKKRKRAKAKRNRTDEPSPRKPTSEEIGRMQELHAAGKKCGEIGRELRIPTLTVYRTLKPLKEEKPLKEGEPTGVQG